MLWVIVAAAVAVVILGTVVVRSYQRFVRQRCLVQEAWGQLEVELGRRHELVRELVSAGRAICSASESAPGESSSPAYAACDQLEQACGAAERPVPELTQRVAVEIEVSDALRELFTAVATHDRVHADHDFLAAQQRIAETEGRIAAGRRFYNANVAAYNRRVDRLPSRLVAANAGFAARDPFEIDDTRIQVTPQVDPAELDTVAGIDDAGTPEGTQRSDPDTPRREAEQPDQHGGSAAPEDRSDPPGPSLLHGSDRD